MGYEDFKVGAIQFPLPASLNAADAVLDPPITALLNYYEFELNRNLLPYWQVYLPTIGLTDYASTVVAEKIPYDPEFYFQDSQYSLPLLALFRTNEIKAEKTVNWYFWKVSAKFRYILPVMTASQALSMMQFLKAIKSIINDRTEQGYDPVYQDGYNVMENAGIARISVTEATYVHLQNPQTNMYLPMLDLSIEFEEREQFASNTFDNFERLDGYVSVADTGNVNQLQVIEFQKDLI